MLYRQPGSTLRRMIARTAARIAAALAGGRAPQAAETLSPHLLSDLGMQRIESREMHRILPR